MKAKVSVKDIPNEKSIKSSYEGDELHINVENGVLTIEQVLQLVESIKNHTGRIFDCYYSEHHNILYLKFEDNLIDSKSIKLKRIEFLDNIAYAALCDYLSCKLNYADYLQKIESINLYLKLNK